MARIIFVTGGSRSGKSSYAQRIAESMSGPRVYVATCPAVDDEMRTRIRRHQRERSERDWQTIEEELDLCGVIGSNHASDVLLVDCLTLWVNNLLYRAEQNKQPITEDEVATYCRSILDACRRHPGTIIFVTSETGMGIIPENRLSRIYRDLVGRCNRIFAESSHRAILLVSGQPLELKKEAMK